LQSARQRTKLRCQYSTDRRIAAMKLSATVSTLLVVALMTGGVPLTSVAAPMAAGTEFRLAQGGGMTLDQAVEQVRRQYNGRIVSAETRVSGNREVHHIKVLTEDGKVKTVTVPGRTLGNG
jgi:hypothetical protein